MKNSTQPIVSKTYTLQKYPGKGGWTYAVIDEIKPDKKEKFGWVKVKGTIDGFEIKQYKLMPMGNGKLFLPVKAEIRKKINKQVGDKIKVILYKDESAFEIPDEFALCLKEEPEAWQYFNRLSESEKRLYVLWIYSAKKIETRTERIVKSIERLCKGLKLYEKIEL